MLYDRGMALESIIRMVSGRLSRPLCDLLYGLAGEVPDDGVILDLYCGEGLFTLVLAAGLKDRGKTQASIVALDTHILKPLSATPHEDGTLLTLMKNLHRARVLQNVVPIVASATLFDKLTNKRSANLVVIQSPVINSTLNGELHSSLSVAKQAIRNGGKIVIFNSHRHPPKDFFQFVNQYFITGFDCIMSTPEVLVYEHTNSKAR